MRNYKMAAAMAVAVASVNAQVSYTTVTYDTCPSVTESLVTITNGVTVTYCPLCEHNGATTTPGPTHTTVYTTTYLSLCPTGMVPETYTVTETCQGAEPTWNTQSDHIPQDFTVTVKTCNVCDSTPVPVTVTEPCGCKATEGTMIPQTQPQPMPTGDSQCTGPNCNAADNGQTGGNGGSGNNTPAPTGNRLDQCPGPNCTGGDNGQTGSNGGDSSVCSGPDCGASSGSSGSGSSGSDSSMCPGPQCQAGSSASAAMCPGPQCQAGLSASASAAASGAASGSMGGDSSPACSGTGCPAVSASGTASPTPSAQSSLTPYTGAAASFGTAGVLSSFAIACIAALAFGL